MVGIVPQTHFLFFVHRDVVPGKLLQNSAQSVFELHPPDGRLGKTTLHTGTPLLYTSLHTMLFGHAVSFVHFILHARSPFVSLLIGTHEVPSWMQSESFLQVPLTQAPLSHTPRPPEGAAHTLLPLPNTSTHGASFGQLLLDVH